MKFTSWLMVTDDKGKTEGGIFVQFETAFNKASLNSGRTGLDAISGFGSVGTTGAISKGSGSSGFDDSSTVFCSTSVKLFGLNFCFISLVEASLDSFWSSIGKLTSFS